MRLSSYTGQINQNFVEAAGAENASALEQGLKNGMDAVMGKSPGQSVTGEVLFRNGTDILISMGKNQLLQAKLEGNMSAQPGQLLTFQIKNNSGSKVILTPLFENLSQDPNVSKALQAAGLPENSVTAGMVRAMMQEGLPIDRQSLYQMNRIINANPQVDLQTMVQMQRLLLPVTPENIQQFEAYKNYQHQMGESLSDIADAFTQTFQEITGSSNLQEGIAFYRDVIGILSENVEGSTFKETEQPKEALTNQNIKDTGVAARDALQQPSGEQPWLSEEENESFALQLKMAGLPDKTVTAVLNKQMSGRAILNEIDQLLSGDEIPDKKAVFELLEGKEFKQLLKSEMTRQWLLFPEEVAKEHSVDKLYERLTSQLNRLNEVLSQTGKGDTPLAKAVSTTTGNIDFMNQLNQMFTYVQLPLKMQGKNASGELFVYTNKKSLAKKEGSVSALLHLDMENLGSVDVHVTLSNQKVSTKFYLQDDSALDLIEQNINILNERLEKRGYSMNAEFINREGNTNVMEEILKQDKNISRLSGYSFDARA